MRTKGFGGFALPAVIITSVVMLAVLLSAVSSTSAVRTSLANQYYQQITRTASDAGLAYAKACLTKNGGVPLWSDSTPLTPYTDCTGTQLAGFNCPTGTTDSRCFILNDNNAVTSTFSVGMPAVNSGGAATTVTASGSTNLLRTSDKSVWRKFTSTSSYESSMTTVEYLVAGGGGGGGQGCWSGVTFGGGGGGAGAVLTGTHVLHIGSYNITVGSGGNTTAGGNSVYDNISANGGSAGQNCSNGGASGNGNSGGGYTIWDVSQQAGGGGGGGNISSGSNGAAPSMIGGQGGFGLTSWITGSPVVYGTGGKGGNTGDGNGLDGSANTANGGNGGGSNGIGGLGGSGVVIIRYSTTSGIVATGGNVTYSGGYEIHTFTSSGAFSVSSIFSQSSTSTATAPVNFLAVGGGGGGGGGAQYYPGWNAGWTAGGGGGAGGYVTGTKNMSAGSYTVTVGNGGSAGSSTSNGNNGENTVFAGTIAYGGGYGAAGGYTGGIGGSGGGGAGGWTLAYSTAGGPSVVGQGNVGGSGSHGDTNGYYAGSSAGGGGATGGGFEAGCLTSNSSCPYGAVSTGGAGAVSSISGTAVTYARGGDGFRPLGSCGATTSSGAANTGNGGGGGGAACYQGSQQAGPGNGGSGIVIVSYPTGSLVATGGTITTSGVNTIHTFTSSDVFQITSVPIVSSDLSISAINPTTALNSTSLSVSSITGANFVSGTTVKLTKSGQSNITCTGFTFTSSTSLTSGTCPTTGAATGTWNVVVTNPNAQTATLTNGLTISTPPSFPSSGLVAYWKLDESSGNATDITGNGRTLTNNNSAPYGSSYGKINNGINFNGSNQYLYSTSFNSLTVPASVSFWFKTNASNAGFIGSYPTVGTRNFYDCAIYDGKVSCEVAQNGYAGAGVTSTSTYNDSNWHHVVFASSLTNIDLYVDGVLVGTQSPNMSGFALTYFTTSWINWTYSPPGVQTYPNGSMDEIGLWSRALTAGEVTTLYNSGNGVSYTPAQVSVQYLIVGGGGGGGGASGYGARGGGGGAGGYLTGTTTLSAGSYTVTVGSGGNGSTNASVSGSNGGNSSFGSLTAAVGGGGGGSSVSGTSNSTAGSGGSGGGGDGGPCHSGQTGGTGTSGQGYAGGNSGGQCAQASGAGGGGAGGAGHNDTLQSDTGMGGNGVSSSISGSATTYAVGGNAGGATSPGVPGNSNTGNGGNGGKNSQSGGNGGSGVVIISYTTGAMNATGGTITTSGGNTIHTFTSGGTFTINSIP